MAHKNLYTKNLFNIFIFSPPKEILAESKPLPPSEHVQQQQWVVIKLQVMNASGKQHKNNV